MLKAKLTKFTLHLDVVKLKIYKVRSHYNSWVAKASPGSVLKTKITNIKKKINQLYPTFSNNTK